MKRLKENLFRDYDTSSRPVRRWSDRTQVAVQMIPLSLDFDEIYDVFTLHSSLHFAWIDEFLVWNASDYGGIEHILLDGDSVWVPEVFHLSSWDITDLMGRKRLCNLFSSGWLHCWDYPILIALCRLDLTHWPYDSQNCTVTLSTVTQSLEEIELMVIGAAVNLQEYIPSRAWKLLTVTVSQYNHIFGNKVFPCLQYNLLLRRSDAISGVTIVVPIIVLVFLVLSSFWLNSEQEVRVNLCCTLLVCHVLFLQNIGHINNGDNAPVIVLFFRDSLVLCVFSLEFAVFMQWLNTTSPRKVPYFFNSVFDSGPAWMLLLLGRRNCLKGSETLNDGRQETADPETVSDVKTRWRDFGGLLNHLFFLVYCLIYLILIFMYVV
ncbi:neuronal acetylcholine receptor subunit alpha-3 isoform X2 [Cryptotermes secundus]|nr:neuronal acetylcholine receptor subunit alpha-3 isoform X2 [Cryptotermes secundus]